MVIAIPRSPGQGRDTVGGIRPGSRSGSPSIPVDRVDSWPYSQSVMPCSTGTHDPVYPVGITPAEMTAYEKVPLRVELLGEVPTLTAV